MPYGAGPYSIRWRSGTLVAYRGDTPADILVPQGDDRFLLRTLWSELRFVEGPTGPTPTLRPLWLEGEPVPLERVAAGANGKTSVKP